jgi:hypothetical protein
MTRGAHPSGATPITATLLTSASYSSCTHRARTVKMLVSEYFFS